MWRDWFRRPPAAVRRAQRAHDLIEWLEIALDRAVVTDLAATVPSAIDTSIVSLWTSSPTNMLRFPMTYLLLVGGCVTP
jgi:hypothetical protein